MLSRHQKLRKYSFKGIAFYSICRAVFENMVLIGVAIAVRATVAAFGNLHFIYCISILSTATVAARKCFFTLVYSGGMLIYSARCAIEALPNYGMCLCRESWYSEREKHGDTNKTGYKLFRHFMLISPFAFLFEEMCWKSL